VRRKRFRRDDGAVLHQRCIRPSIGACLLRAIMDISGRAISLADRHSLRTLLTAVTINNATESLKVWLGNYSLLDARWRRMRPA
jgi:hypothetical protein